MFLTLIQWSEDVVPTVAFNFKKIRKGSVTMKIWDVAGMRLFPSKYYLLDQYNDCLSGQPKFRSMWERYCHGVDAVV